jgi:fructose-specific phosphotransferase system IIC component
MSDASVRQSIVDDEHLKLLSICYMISAAISAVFSLFGLMYGAMGAFITEAIKRAPELAKNTDNAPPAFIGWIFGAIGVGLFVIWITMAGLKLGVALCLKKRKSRTFCMVVAAFECLGVPYGTLLGIFTFIVLGRESVERLFDASGAPRPVA